MNSSFSNQRVIKTYFQSLEDKVLKKFKTQTKRVNESQIHQALLELLPHPKIQAGENESNPQDLLSLVKNNQEQIMEKQESINFLKTKIRREDELTYSFFKTLMREKTKNLIQTVKATTLKEREKTQNPFSLLVSRCQPPSDFDDKENFRSPICDLGKSIQVGSSGSSRECATSRTKVTGSRYQSSEFALELEADDKEMSKALSKLRKLEKFVFEKEKNERKIGKNESMWNYGVSPTKKRFQEENKNLKAIQGNLITHISIMEKFREIPAVEGLVAKEEKLKKQERCLRMREDEIQKKEMELNKKHSQFLKKQKSQKIL